MCGTPHVDGGWKTTKEMEREKASDIPDAAVRCTLHADEGGQTTQGRDKGEITRFLSLSVLPVTVKAYDGHWKAWNDFLREEFTGEDPLMQGRNEEEKVERTVRFLYSRYQNGQRGKAATGVTAGLRYHFGRAMQPLTFLDSQVITMARAACRMNPAEARAKKDQGPAETVKLPICEEIVDDIRMLCWGQLPWGPSNTESRMLYLACVYGFEMAARISEYTTAERGKTDHCVRLNDLTFTVRTNRGIENIAGGRLAALGLTAPPDQDRGLQRILECRILTSTSKGKTVVKPKLIGRRTPEEVQFLEDLSAFICHSGGAGNEELFTFRRPSGEKVSQKPRPVRDAVKRACEDRGLPGDYFSGHSLRKAGITHMHAAGATEDDRRDRGNYAPGSQVMNLTYDYASGLGPLAANSLTGGHRLNVQDVRRLIPPTRNQAE